VADRKLSDQSRICPRRDNCLLVDSRYGNSNTPKRSIIRPAVVSSGRECSIKQSNHPNRNANIADESNSVMNSRLRMMMHYQRAGVRECRMNGRKDQETGNTCGSNWTSVEVWEEQYNKGEHLIYILHFDFLNVNLVPKNDFGNRNWLFEWKVGVEKRNFGSPEIQAFIQRPFRSGICGYLLSRKRAVLERWVSWQSRMS
jgi:hypothetical protein